MFLHLIAHPYAVVADRQHHILARCRLQVLRHVAHIQREIGGLDG